MTNDRPQLFQPILTVITTFWFLVIFDRSTFEPIITLVLSSIGKTQVSTIGLLCDIILYVP